jgi:hypothetical protein
MLGLGLLSGCGMKNLLRENNHPFTTGASCPPSFKVVNITDLFTTPVSFNKILKKLVLFISTFINISQTL